MHRTATLLIALLLFVPAAATAASRSRTPEWVQEYVTAPTPEHAKGAAAVVLLDECVRRVREDGGVTSRYRRVVRVLKLDGRDHASVFVPYSADHEKVTALDAWLVPADGNAKTYSRKDAADVAQDLDDVFTEARVLALSATDAAQAGAVFACAWTIEERSIFPQSRWSFQGALPVAVSRITYEVPNGWQVKAVPLAGTGVAVTAQPGRHVWESSNLPPTPQEPLSLAAADLQAAIALEMVAPEQARLRLPWPRLASWRDVSSFIARLHDERARPDAAINARTRELVAGAESTWEKIRAIARYVQGVNYASVQLGVGRGGGYTPNPAGQVLSRHYGDCKDKTVLMRAMLETVGVRSYSTIAFLQERRKIAEAWPSPMQFNHCIIAIAIDEPVDGDVDAVIEHPELGRILIFDPTNALAPPGELLASQQGSHVLVCAGTDHDLLELPDLRPEANRLAREIVARLEPNGVVAGRLTETATGGIASDAARVYRSGTPADFERIIQNWLSQSARMARIADLVVRDGVTEAGTFDFELGFSARNFARSLGGQLLVFRPAIELHRSFQPLTNTTRTTPVLLAPVQIDETFVLTLPAGFHVDELPPPVEIVQPFGTYVLAGEVRDGTVSFRRKYVVHAAEIPVENYADVRAFFEGIRRAEQTPVVLKRG